MRRLFWVGVGAVGAVLVVDRLRRTARRYTPAGVSERVEAASRTTTSALLDAYEQFRAAMGTRERDLVDTLLVTPEGGDPSAVFRRRRRASDDGWSNSGWAEDASPAPEGKHADAPNRPTGRVDPDEPLYDF